MNVHLLACYRHFNKSGVVKLFSWTQTSHLGEKCNLLLLFFLMFMIEKKWKINFKRI